MPAERFFLADPLQKQDQPILKGTEFHHLAHVMRARKGDRVELVNGKGTLANAKVEEILKDRAILTIYDSYTERPRSVQVILAQAIPKLNRLEFILEKGTELGVDVFWLFPSALSIKKDFSDSQLERLHTLVIAAMKQCGRLFLPEICIKNSFKSWPQLPPSTFFGDLDPQAPNFSFLWQQLTPTSPIIFFTGPESGFTDEEISLLRTKGAKGTRLHSNTLRTDTASLVALSLIEHWLL